MRVALPPPSLLLRRWFPKAQDLVHRKGWKGGAQKSGAGSVGAKGGEEGVSNLEKVRAQKGGREPETQDVPELKSAG